MSLLLFSVLWEWRGFFKTPKLCQEMFHTAFRHEFSIWSGMNMISFSCEGEVCLWQTKKRTISLGKWWLKEESVFDPSASHVLTAWQGCQQCMKTSICTGHCGSFSLSSPNHFYSCTLGKMKAHKAGSQNVAEINVLFKY